MKIAHQDPLLQQSSMNLVGVSAAHPAGAIAGLAALAVHNLFDFNLQLPGVMLAAIAAAAIAIPATMGPADNKRRVVASPTPDKAPVTTAALPLRSAVIM